MNEDQEIALQVLEHADTSHSLWGRANCPFCLSRTGKEDRRGSFSVNAESGYFHCFKCGIKGKIQHSRFKNRRVSYEPKPLSVIRAPEGFMPLHKEPGVSAMVLQPARDYLVSRGFGKVTWGLLNIGACYQGYFSERVIVPIMDSDNTEWRGFVARDWTGNALRKYMYPKGMNRADLLFQEHLLYSESPDPVLVVEGVFDALPYVGHAVACLGKPTHNQFKILCKSKRPLVVALDGDAWEEGYSLSMKLKLHGKKANFIKIPPGEDPGSVDAGWLLQEAYRLSHEGDK